MSDALCRYTAVSTNQKHARVERPAVRYGDLLQETGNMQVIAT